MQKIGSYLIVLGLLAIVMNFFNFVPRILAWIYQWGNGAAWAIKIAIVALGIVLYLMGEDKNSEKSA
jgi:hypothetical protein